MRNQVVGFMGVQGEGQRFSVFQCRFTRALFKESRVKLAALHEDVISARLVRLQQ
jgi:hypothetical protein